MLATTEAHQRIETCESRPGSIFCSSCRWCFITPGLLDLPPHVCVTQHQQRWLYMGRRHPQDDAPTVVHDAGGALLGAVPLGAGCCATHARGSQAGRHALMHTNVAAAPHMHEAAQRVGTRSCTPTWLLRHTCARQPSG
eukprot:364933-Chlamydomonas_euryale.AAC.23